MNIVSFAVFARPSRKIVHFVNFVAEFSPVDIRELPWIIGKFKIGGALITSLRYLVLFVKSRVRSPRCGDLSRIRTGFTLGAFITHYFTIANCAWASVAEVPLTVSANYLWLVPEGRGSLRKHQFLFAPRRWGRFARGKTRNVPSGEERGETNVFAG